MRGCLILGVLLSYHDKATSHYTNTFYVIEISDCKYFDTTY